MRLIIEISQYEYLPIYQLHIEISQYSYIPISQVQKLHHSAQYSREGNCWINVSSLCAKA
jgi:hypothetical protein